MIWKVLVGAIAGYLIGAVSPAYVLGRLIRGIDIRTVNYRNAGARNVGATLGVWPAVITGVIDTLKGIGAVLLVARMFQSDGYLLLAPAVAAVAGHIFPFYLGFRGGRGTATSVGLFIYVCAVEIVAGSLAWYLFAGLLICAVLIYVATRSGDATALFAFLGMIVVSVADLGLTPNGAIALVMAAYAFLHAVFRGRDVGLYSIERGENFLGWRAITRPLALLFVPLAVFMPRMWFLGLLSVLAAAALVLDIVRVAGRRTMAGVYRSDEHRKLSSISLFLIAVLMLFVLFPVSTAALALAYLTIGDLAGKLTGMRFGRRELLGGRTLVGSVGFLAGSLISGYAMARVFGAPGLPIVLAGAAGAAVIELLTIGLDDNLTVGLGSAGLITLLLLI